LTPPLVKGANVENNYELKIKKSEII